MNTSRTNWLTLTIMNIVIITLFMFLVKDSLKNKKNFDQQLNQDYSIFEKDDSGRY